ncbi:hypothetical protein TOPH_06650, partial [Tolypocladium ophioglossoides CBS 100239]
YKDPCLFLLFCPRSFSFSSSLLPSTAPTDYSTRLGPALLKYDIPLSTYGRCHLRDPMTVRVCSPTVVTSRASMANPAPSSCPNVGGLEGIASFEGVSYADHEVPLVQPRRRRCLATC